MNAESTLALKVEDLGFSLQKKTLLSGVSFEVHAGQSFAVIGHNGAGKTTLFHLLLGLKFPDQGTISIFNEPSQSARSRARLGYVPERPYLNLDLKFEEVLELHFELIAIEPHKRNSELRRVAETVGLQNHLNQRLKTFSKGMLQKTMIAQALLGDPRLLILDEPMSGLDPETRAALKGWISQWKGEGRTILFSTHALEDVETLADQVLVLKGGRIEFLGSESAWKERA